MITDLSTGGAQITLLRLLSAIDRNRYNPSVICFNNGNGIIAKEIKNLKIPVINLGMTHKGRIDAFLRLSRLIHDAQPVILHTWLFHANITGRLLGRLNKVPIIITSRRNINIGGKWRELLKRLTSGLDDKVIAVCEAVRQAEIVSSKIPAEKVVTIYNGINPLYFAPVSIDASRKIRNSFEIPDDAFLLGAIGRLHPSKGFNDLISALAYIKATTNSVRLIIVGEGELRDSLELQIINHNLSGTIKFAGLRNDIPEILSSLDVLVSPSLWEGMPNVVLEAMAAGKPVVATSVGGTPETVVDGETGLLVPPRNHEALATAILRLLGNSELRTRMGHAGRERVLNHFSIQRMVTKTQHLYKELMIEKGVLE
jgi:glycosyltransferase involved in cell wall biosynthesis